VGHEVEGQRPLRAREVGPVHADQADDPKRDAAHGHHIAEVDPSGQEAVSAAVVVHQLPDQGAQHV